MHWAATAVTGTDVADLLERALQQVGDQLPDSQADLVFAWPSADLAGHADEILKRLRSGLGGPHVLGCGAGGVVGGGREFERVPALSLLAGRLPGAAVHGFHVTAAALPDPDAPPRAWHELAGVSPADAPSFVLLADPHTLPVERLLEGLDFAYPQSVKVGGMASAATEPGGQVLLDGDRLHFEGCVGVALMGNVEVQPLVAQGCRAVGPPMRITACDGHLLSTLDGRPVLEALQGAFDGASSRDRRLASHALFLGFEIDPFASDDDAPWLIRNVLGVEPESRGLYVAEPLRKGRRVRFHVRDRETSAEDLAATLQRAEAGPNGALLFSCLGRGRGLYGSPDHDSRGFLGRFGDVPLGGFFCSGEIGPVGGATRLHGFTSVFGLLRPRTAGS